MKVYCFEVNGDDRHYSVNVQAKDYDEAHSKVFRWCTELFEDFGFECTNK